MLMTATRSWRLCALLLVSTGCNEVCNENAVPGIVLEIVAPDDAPIPMATISYVFDGQMFVDTCSEELVPCREYDLGDAPGLYEITIEAEGFEPWYLAADLEHDGCHPITQEHTIVLEPA